MQDGSASLIKPLSISARFLRIFFVVLGSIANNSLFFASNQVAALPDAEMNKFAQNDILFYDPDECVDGTNSSNGSVKGTKDFSKVLTAKNADKSVFNVSDDDQWSARWGDGNEKDMKKLLENYGDLAYQLGAAVGAPYIAILVQMRYEDPNSVCGKNNFWGNGCPSGTGAGGASIQGKNLGEGFKQYGQTLTNGMHDQALGISDPKEYLEKIGPTWVQGDPNGAGYGQIEGMKASVDALTKYIESKDGQAIVKEFGNYHGTGGLCCDPDDPTGVKWKDGWIEENSLKGMHKENVNKKDDLNETPNPVGSYTTDGGKPNKILLHSTEGYQNGYAAYPSGNKYPAHFTIDLKKKEAYQHFSIWQPALAIADHDRSGPIQIEIVGFSGDGGSEEYQLKNFKDEDWDYLVTILRAISEETGIPLTSSVEWKSGTKRLSSKEFIKYKGILGHMHAPGNSHTDPGNIWKYVSAAIDRAGGYNDSCNGGGGDITATALKLAWPKPHNWDDPSPAYAKALKEVKLDKYGDSCVQKGGSCDAFVATVMRYSGADPDFACCGVSSQYDYILKSNKYTEVKNDLNSLQPGDIRISPGEHIELYIEVNGEPHIASASHCERNANIENYYNNNYKVFRLK